MARSVTYINYEGFLFKNNSINKLVKELSPDNVCVGDIYRCTYYWSNLLELEKKMDEEEKQGLPLIDTDFEGCFSEKIKKELVKKNAILVRLGNDLFVDLEQFNRKNLNKAIKFNHVSPTISFGKESIIMDISPEEEGELFVDIASIKIPEFTFENKPKVLKKFRKEPV